MKHLSSEAWAQLRAGKLAPAEAAQVLRHLEEDCEACDAVVAELDEPALECSVDRALARLGEGREPAVDRRIEQQVIQAIRRPRLRRWWLAPVALAAGAAIFVLTGLDPGAPGQRLKGGVARPPSLTAVVSLKKGGPIEPLAAPRTYPSGAELFFTYELPTDAHAYLGRVGVDGMVEPFYPPLGVGGSLERAGVHPLTVGGTVHGYSLEGLRGKQRFVVIGSPTPLDSAALLKALAAAPASGASVEVEVE